MHTLNMYIWYHLLSQIDKAKYTNRPYMLQHTYMQKRPQSTHLQITWAHTGVIYIAYKGWNWRSPPKSNHGNCYTCNKNIQIVWRKYTKKAPRISANCVLIWVYSNKCSHLISIKMSSIMKIQRRYSIRATLISLRTTEQQGPQCTNHRRHASRQAAKNRLWFCF